MRTYREGQKVTIRNNKKICCEVRGSTGIVLAVWHNTIDVRTSKGVYVLAYWMCK
jgi:hypothetical protein